MLRPLAWVFAAKTDHGLYKGYFQHGWYLLVPYYILGLCLWFIVIRSAGQARLSANRSLNCFLR